MRAKICGAVLLVVCCLFTMTACAAKGIDAKKWLLARYDTLGILQMYCEEMDDVVSLYLSSSMPVEEFLSEISFLSDVLEEMALARKEDPVKVGSHTYETKLGMDGYNKIWSDLRSLTDVLLTQESLLYDQNQLTYLYMGYRDAIAQDYEDYYVGYLEAGGEFNAESEGAVDSKNEGGGEESGS